MTKSIGPAGRGSTGTSPFKAPLDPEVDGLLGNQPGSLSACGDQHPSSSGSAGGDQNAHFSGKCECCMHCADFMGMPLGGGSVSQNSNELSHCSTGELNRD